MKISVIMPVYNAGHYLYRSIESIQKQTEQDFEIIAVDDGSKDESLAILKELQAKDDRIKIITREERGYAVTMNEALNAAAGDYVLNVDPDDWIEPDMFERMLSEFEDDVEVDTIEESMIPPYYSYATLHALKNKYSNHETYLLVGEDLVNQIPDWMNGGQILKDWDLLVVDRPNGALSSSLYRQCPTLFGMFIPEIIKDEVYYYYNEHGKELEL
jgi:glycosyltransferase involved in cell wall biosynthesis